MKIVLSQRTSAGIVSIGRGPDGKFHVLWKGKAVGAAETLVEAMALAADGPLERPPDGPDLGKLSVSWRAKDWYILD